MTELSGAPSGPGQTLVWTNESGVGNKIYTTRLGAVGAQIERLAPDQFWTWAVWGRDVGTAGPTVGTTRSFLPAMLAVRTEMLRRTSRVAA